MLKKVIIHSNGRCKFKYMSSICEHLVRARRVSSTNRKTKPARVEENKGGKKQKAYSINLAVGRGQGLATLTGCKSSEKEHGKIKGEGMRCSCLSDDEFSLREGDRDVAARF